MAETPRNPISRTDIAALAVEVGQLGAAVYDLQALIVASMETATAAQQEAAAATTALDDAQSKEEARRSHVRLRRLVVVLSTLSIAAVATLGLGGFAAAVKFNENQNNYRQLQYDGCVKRNAEIAEAKEDSARGRAFFANLIAAQQRAADRGELTAQEFVALLEKTLAEAPEDPDVTAEPIDCEQLLTAR